MKPIIRKTMTPDWDRVGIEVPMSIFHSSTTNLEELPGSFHPRRRQSVRSTQHFITGSSYEGTWDGLGFAGYGTYTFPHGAIYEGHFENGEFHGGGVITYPTGHKLKGTWLKGKLISKIFVFNDGLEVTYPWRYCQFPDRRFQVEVNTTLKGPGEELLTNKQPTVEIPEGCFDTIDGYYNPSVKCIFNYDEGALAKGTKPENKQKIDNLKRTVLPEESEFIEKNFRQADFSSVGYRPDLYEYWMVGKEQDVEGVGSLNSEKSSADSSLVLTIASFSENSSSKSNPVSVSITS